MLYIHTHTFNRQPHSHDSLLLGGSLLCFIDEYIKDLDVTISSSCLTMFGFKFHLLLNNAISPPESNAVVVEKS